MSSQELTEYRKRLRGDSTLDLYVPRRFTAATLEGGTEPDLDYFQWRGVLREREPGLDEILKHPRVVILGEPGAGKSLVAQVAVQKGLSNAERVPVFSELKQYRGDLGKLLRVAAPNSILDNNV